MFAIILLFLGIFITTNASTETKRPDLYVFTTKHQGYICERWVTQGYKESSLEEAGLEFTALDISRDTRKVRIKMADGNGGEYSSYFNRNQGEVKVSFDYSEVSDEVDCSDLKSNLDDFFAEDWSYKTKLNKFLSVEFPAGIKSKYSEQTGKTYARFFGRIYLRMLESFVSVSVLGLGLI